MLAKCENVHSHLSSNSYQVAYVRDGEWRGCHLSRGGQPPLRVRHLSSRGAHLSW
jgi:hypothetical protein